jgi:hypothetical protein
MVFSMALYIASMLLPVGPMEGISVPGCFALFGGFVGFVMCVFTLPNVHADAFAGGLLVFLSWLANPVFWLGFHRLIVEKPRKSAFASGTSMVLGLLVLPLVLWGIPAWPAYWAWLASFAVLAIGSVFCMFTEAKSRLEHDAVAMPENPTDDCIIVSPASHSAN